MLASRLLRQALLYQAQSACHYFCSPASCSQGEQEYFLLTSVTQLQLVALGPAPSAPCLASFAGNPCVCPGDTWENQQQPNWCYSWCEGDLCSSCAILRAARAADKLKKITFHGVDAVRRVGKKCQARKTRRQPCPSLSLLRLSGSGVPAGWSVPAR